MDKRVLELLAKEYPTADAVSAEIINLQAICQLPKGTEYFFSDIHGEADAFCYLLGTASGVIGGKIEALFQNSVPEEERNLLSALINNPEEVLREHPAAGENDWCRVVIFRLVQVCRSVASKYTRSKVRKKMPKQFAYVLDELLHGNTEENKEQYYSAIISSIIDTGVAHKFIIALCRLIRKCAIDQLHIIGDIFDRGPHADLVLDEMMQYNDVDIQWGNHDIHWMGAAAGNPVCIASVVRAAIGYNNFDLLEDGYGINLRPLSTFAAEVYRDDPCTIFRPKMLDTNIYDPIDAELAAKMHKAIAILQFKLEGQLYRRRPDFGMSERDLLSAVDFEAGKVTVDGKRYALLDTSFPTVDPADPLKLSPGEAELLAALTRSFTHAGRLAWHMRFLMNNGSMYKIANGNLMYHGCIPMDKDGRFSKVSVNEKMHSGRALLDAIDKKIRAGFYAPPEERAEATDFLWFLWCGRKSPIFGKSKMATFERYFIKEAATHKEVQDPYYQHIDSRETCEAILHEFGLSPETSHIINGHVPVRQGESPIRGGGLLFVIDGGISKAYQQRTGIGGYTLISNSHSLALAEHLPFAEAVQGGTFHPPSVRIVERYPATVKVRDTDTGARIQRDIEGLSALLAAYRDGTLREK